MADQDDLGRQAIARRAYAFHESAGSNHSKDQEHRCQAEQELTLPDSRLQIEPDGLTLLIRFPIETENGTQILASISSWSVLLFTIPAEPVVDGSRAAMRDLVRYILLPQEVIPGQVTTLLDDDSLTLRLPIMLGLRPAAQSVIVATS